MYVFKHLNERRTAKRNALTILPNTVLPKAQISIKSQQASCVNSVKNDKPTARETMNLTYGILNERHQLFTAYKIGIAVAFAKLGKQHNRKLNRISSRVILTEIFEFLSK